MAGTKKVAKPVRVMWRTNDALLAYVDKRREKLGEERGSKVSRDAMLNEIVLGALKHDAGAAS